ncbi:MAG: hypothetical protein ACOYO1_11250 [Bacteroidales bacterium]
MSKVFRLQDNNTPGLTQANDWFNSNKFTPNLIDAIPDPDGGLGSVPTSIPSPFARIDLFNTAFKVVADSNDLEGVTVFHRMVSEALDIAEILFYYHLPNINQNIEIIKWQLSDINELISSDLVGHKKYGETLQLYIDQDNSYFHFSQLNGLYIIKYKNQIIGGTSPLTLFFSSKNSLQGLDITFPNGDVPLDNILFPLYKRDKEFIIYLYALKAFFPNFTTLFNNLNNYLGAVYVKIQQTNPVLYNLLSNSNNLAATYNDVNKLQNIILPNGLLEIFNIPLKQEKANNILTSDFKIKPDRIIDNNIRLPLILKNSFDGLDSQGNVRKYVNDGDWQNNYNVPFKPSELTIDNRHLPHLGIPYPWLTVSDFFEPYLVRLVYPIDNKKYFDGNQSKENEIEKGFLLPIKTIFFDYFDANYLMNHIFPDGKRIYEINKVGNQNIRATLRIPIEKGYIEFDRIYFNKTTPNETNNEGAILECQFGITIFPFFKTNDPLFNANYRIQIIDRDVALSTRHHDYYVNLFNNEGEKIADTIKKDRFTKDTHSSGTRYIIVNKEFDIIQIDNGVARGIVLPIFRKVTTNGAETFTFAIDFGTTNTHIEYNTVSQPTPKPFEILNENEVQIGSLMDTIIIQKDKSLHGSGATDIYNYINQELMPEILGETKNYCFPIRTVLSNHESINDGQSLISMASANIPFVYEKNVIAKGSITTTNLKWSNINNEINRNKVNAFIETLFLLIKNKVLLNNGNLALTKIKWFYPSSMNKGRIDELHHVFSTLYKKHINQQQEIEYPVLESIAPFYFYRSMHGLNAAQNPFLLIDIGGETTDVVVYKNNHPLFQTSFRFAGNALFGDGFSKLNIANSNWFINTFKEDFKTQLEGYQDLSQIYDNVLVNNNTLEIISQFFSFEKNSEIIKNNDVDNLSFSKKLQENDKIKIVFLVFYTSIIYHIAKLFKQKGITLPRYICFSGTGSKINNLISPSSSDTLEEYTKIIFEEILGVKYDLDGLDLIIDKKPKETTCKGGLLINNTLKNVDRSILLSDKDIDLSDITYSNILDNSGLLSNVEKEYFEFIDFFYKLNQRFNFSINFSANTNLDTVIKYLKKDVMQSIKEGIEIRKSELADTNTSIDETLFFYPLINNIYKTIQNI